MTRNELIGRRLRGTAAIKRMLRELGVTKRGMQPRVRTSKTAAGEYSAYEIFADPLTAAQSVILHRHGWATQRYMIDEAGEFAVITGWGSNETA